jgi:hypothetical protein
MKLIDELAFMQALKELGYQEPRPLGDGRYACLFQFMFTWGIIVGRIGDEHSYDDRWCYHHREAAARALADWSGEGEPQGWHRHPSTGRRRPEGDALNEYVAR